MAIANQTLERIEQTILQDQGASYREAILPFITKMEDAYRGAESKFRSHMGLSLIGRECDRELWYGFHWVKLVKHDARLLRLFNRGHIEEARFLALLKAAGFTVWFESEEGGQYRVSALNGHFGSALDGVVMGLPELPDDTPALCEFKTASDSMFNKVKKQGIKKAKPEHYTQMQGCMKWYALDYGLYMVVNKNTDELYAEIIEYDSLVAEDIYKRAETIIASDLPPPMINRSPGWHTCTYCNFLDVCKYGAPVEKNCRTCRNSRTDLTDGNKPWVCVYSVPTIDDKEKSMEGCPHYVKIDAL